uniref:Protein YIPF n=1 Tax=Leptobrachium leishanense TaxID=445787 RepID=A0A8C5M198_9ANUR
MFAVADYRNLETSPLTEFDEAADLLAADPDAPTKSAKEESKAQHATLHVGPDSEGEEGDTDQTELLAPQKKSSGFWTFQYYQDFFDIDTYQVMSGDNTSLLSVSPCAGRDRLHIPELPPVCVTLCWEGQTPYPRAPSCLCHPVLGGASVSCCPRSVSVSVAGVLIYSYAWLVPLCLWGFLQWRKGVIQGVGSYSFMETVCVYGYSLTAYIPTTVLCVIPYEPFRWGLIILAMCISGLVLVLAFWPHIRSDNKMMSAGMVLAMVALHVLLAVFSTPESQHVPRPAFQTSLLIY